MFFLLSYANVVICLLLSKIFAKDVVNVENGEKLGRIRDVDINIETGQINSIIISEHQGFSNVFKNNKKIILNWKNNINMTGEIILVKK